MIASIGVFSLAAIVVVGAVLAYREIAEYNDNLSAAIRRLELAYDSLGVTWLYRHDEPFRKKVLRCSEDVFEASDAPEVRAAKSEILNCRAKGKPAIWRAVTIMLGSMALCIVVALLGWWITPTS